jgi:hypothetical protein
MAATIALCGVGAFVTLQLLVMRPLRVSAHS